MAKINNRTTIVLQYTKSEERLLKEVEDLVSNSIYKAVVYQAFSNRMNMATDVICLEMEEVPEKYKGKKNLIEREDASPIYLTEKQADLLIQALLDAQVYTMGKISNAKELAEISDNPKTKDECKYEIEQYSNIYEKYSIIMSRISSKFQ